jgi:ceramide glucosyltransferase
MFLSHPVDLYLGIACSAVATSYGLLSVLALLVWRIPRSQGAAAACIHEGVSILKPLCGNEPGLYEDLRSFCVQDYPAYQIIFGLHDQSDPAREVAERLKREFRGLSIDIAIDPRLHGSNAKVSNLINMPYACYDVLAMVDSDAAVGSDYLKAVVAPLQDEGVGLVTCLYRSSPTPGIWSRLGAMYVNDWYMPAVLLALLFGHRNYVSGQTVCMRQKTLRALGGLSTLANYLAEDYRLGELVRSLGLRIVLSPYTVIAECHEPSLGAMMRHEIRWMRTLRALRSHSFCGLFLTFSLPLAALGLMLASTDRSGSLLVQGLFAVSAACRLALHAAHRSRDVPSAFRDLWLLPIRDLMIACVWLLAFAASRITWRGQDYDVGPDGFMRRSS